MVPLTLLRHTSRWGEHQECKSAIFDFYYSICILSLLSLLSLLLVFCFWLSSLYEPAFGWHTRIAKKEARCLSQSSRQCTSRRHLAGAVFALLLSSSLARSCGVAISQLEAFFSHARSTTLCILTGSETFSSSCFPLRSSCFTEFRTAYITWDLMGLRHFLILMDGEYSDSPLLDEFVIPKRPIWAESTSTFRTATEQLCSVSGGMRTSEIARSSGFRRSSISGRVLVN